MLEALSKVIDDARALKRIEQQWPETKPAATSQERAQQILALSEVRGNAKEPQKPSELLGAKQRIGRVIWTGNRCRLEFDKDLGADRVEALLQLLRAADV
jgi:hypothetical protein